jgi:hypothetical protein
VPRLAPKRFLIRAEGAWNRATRTHSTHGLPREQFIACEALKLVWRAANPAIVHYWTVLEEAACKAVSRPGRVYRVRQVAEEFDLPSSQGAIIEAVQATFPAQLRG